MKKIYLSLVCLATLSLASAQLNNNLPASNFRNSNFKILPSSNSTKGVEKANAGEVVWTNDFSNTSDWVIDNNSKIGLIFGWNINSAIDGKYFTGDSFTSTSGGNFAELNNGDIDGQNANQPAIGVTYKMTTKSSINVDSLAGGGNVSLSFQQYGARFRDAQEIYISTDGVNFVKVGDNTDLPINSNAAYHTYDNPSVKTINLSSFIVDNATKVWIQFRWTSAVLNSQDVNDWSCYGWMIDDVQLTKNFDNDLVQSKVLFGSVGAFGTRKGDLAYYKVPVSQIQPIDFGAIVKNYGANTQSDVVFNATSTNYSGASAATSVNTTDMDTLWVENAFTPSSTLGSKTITFSTTSGATDGNPSNNGTAAIAPVTISVTNYIYARDNNIHDYNIGMYDNTNTAIAFQVGNIFDIFADQTLYSMDVVLDASTTVGTMLKGLVYEISASDGSLTVLDNTDDIAVTTGKPGKTMTLEFLNAPQLSAGNAYLITVETAGGDTGKKLVIQAGGYCLDGTSLIMDETEQTPTWRSLSVSPMIRMNFQDTRGISEIENDIAMNIYPNPANTQANVSFSLKTQSQVVVSVSDLSGKTVYTNDLGNLNIGNHSTTINTDSFSNGVYVVKFVTNGSTSTQKLVVRK